MEKKKEIASTLELQVRVFAKVADSFATIVHDELKLFMKELPRPDCGFEWVIKSESSKVVIQLYSDGTVRLHLLNKDQKSIDIEIDNLHPTAIYNLRTDNHFDMLLSNLRLMLCIDEAKNNFRVDNIWAGQ